MTHFSGFPSGKVRQTPLPAQFFSELLPEINDLGELKVTLYVFWRLDRMEGTFRYLREADILGDAAFMGGLGRTLKERQTTLGDALERAVQRGTLLRAALTPKGKVPLPEGGDILYFLNSPKGRAAIKGLEQGKWRPADLPQVPIELSQERPNVFQLYESHIGPLTPMIAETLRDAEDTYPAEWIEDAMQIAVENNVRRWRYIEAILQNWQEHGKDERKNRLDDAETRRQAFKELAKRLGQ